MIYFDAHVHIHQRFALDQFLVNSLKNFGQQRQKDGLSEGASYILLLTESKEADVFSSLRAEAETKKGLLPDPWKVELTQENESLCLRHKDWADSPLYIFAGRQVVAKERLEVLALATDAKIADGLSMRDAIAAVQEHHGIAVLPWGAGKWLGSRGEIISRLVDDYTADAVFVGDNGGRPVVWSAPKQFGIAAKKGMGLLPGSDPLPLAGEENRVGSYGAKIPGQVSAETPAADFKKLLQEQRGNIVPFGVRMGLYRFLRLQIGLRL